MPGALVGEEGRGQETEWSENLLGGTELNSFPSWSVFGRGGTTFQGTKETTGVIELPWSLAKQQRHLLREAKLEASFG